MIRRVLISGGAGFIGSRLVLSLAGRDYIVTVLDNLSDQIHGSNPENSFLYNSIRDKVIFIKGDVRCQDDWAKALEGQDAVIHLAADTGTGQSMYEVFRYTDVNAGGTARMLDVLTKTKNNISKIVLGSSRAVYGEGRYNCPVHKEVYPSSRNVNDLKNGLFLCRCPLCHQNPEPLPTHEESLTNPCSVYGISKLSQEHLILITGLYLGIPSVVFRFQNVYGPGQSLLNPYTGLLSVFSTQIKNKCSLDIFEDGDMKRDFVYIDDVVRAIIIGLENENANYKIYNVGTGDPVSVPHIAEKLILLYQADVKTEITGNFRLGDIRCNYADITQIRKDLNFNPEYNLEKGLTEFVKWVNTQKIDNDISSGGKPELIERGIFK